MEVHTAQEDRIYILLSIKTRIETAETTGEPVCVYSFISYYPLKQGLKLSVLGDLVTEDPEFISYYPLKQGLKLSMFLLLLPVVSKFISYYPLKQGLKQSMFTIILICHIYLYPTIH